MRRADLLLVPVLLAALAARHLFLYFNGTAVAHLSGKLQMFERMDRGELFVWSPTLWELDLQLGGPLYFWLHLPIRLVDNPILGLHLLYYGLEAGGLVFWLLWGLRAGLSRPLVWLSALFLLGYWDGNATLAENTIVANLLAVPLFMATLVAVVHGGRRPLRSAVLPGVLFSLTVQVHQLCLVLAPVLALALLRGPDRWRRLGGLGAGFFGAYLVALPGVVIPGGAGLGQVWERMSGLDLAVLPRHLLAAPLDLLALAGLLLALACWWRPLARAPWPALRLAALWLVVGIVLLLLSLTYITHSMNNEHRYGFLKPARAALSAAFLLWLGGSLGAGMRRLPRLGRGPRAALVTLVLVVITLGLGAPGLLALVRSTALVGDHDQRSCSRSRDLPLSRSQYPLTEVILALARDGEGQAARPVRFHGPWYRELNLLARGVEASLRWPARSARPALGVLALPWTPGLERARVARIPLPANVTLVPGVRPLGRLPRRGGPARFILPEGPEPLLLAVTGGLLEVGRAQLGLTVEHRGAQLVPLGRCPCRFEFPTACALYQLPRGGGELLVSLRAGAVAVKGWVEALRLPAR